MMTRASLASVMLASVLMCAAGAAPEKTEAAFKPGDIVFVQVYRHPDLSVTTQIDETGHVELNYIGRVSVGGLTEADATARVSKAYGAILKNPRVTVSRSVSGGMASSFSPRTEDMDTRVIALQNSNAEVLNAALAGMSTAGGSVSFDPSTNSIILTDTAATLQKMMGVIQELDQMQSQVAQVHIEAKIAEVQSGAVKEVGVRWFTQGDHVGTGYIPGTRQDARVNSVRMLNDPLVNEQVDYGDQYGGGREYINDQNWDRRLQVPLTVPTPGQFFLGYMNAGIDFGTLLDALVADNKAEMLASPYIRTVNHQKAEIRMTEEYPFSEAGSVGFGTVSNTRFLDIGIILEVTPHIRQANDGATYVQLELRPEVSSANGMANGVPVRSVRSSNTVANVLDGQTLVIGGIRQNDSRDVVQKVPGVGNLPIVGPLFRHKERSKAASELMIFVTPRVYAHPADMTWDRTLNLSEVVKATDIMQPVGGDLESRKE